MTSADSCSFLRRTRSWFRSILIRGTRLTRSLWCSPTNWNVMKGEHSGTPRTRVTSHCTRSDLSTVKSQRRGSTSIPSLIFSPQTLTLTTYIFSSPIYPQRSSTNSKSWRIPTSRAIRLALLTSTRRKNQAIFTFMTRTPPLRLQ